MRMHRIVFLTFFVVFVLTSNAFAVTVNIDSEELTLEHQPIIEKDTTLVPMRSFFEAMGAEVKWFDESRTIVAVRGGRVILMSIDYPVGVVFDPDPNSYTSFDDPPIAGNLKVEKFIVNPKLYNNNTYIPLRFVGQALMASVDWDGQTESITINTTVDYRKKTPDGLVKQIYDGFIERWNFDTWNSIAQQKVSIGMTAEQVLLSWGKPNSINTTIIENHKNEQWVYGNVLSGAQYVYLDNGKVSALQTF